MWSNFNYNLKVIIKGTGLSRLITTMLLKRLSTYNRFTWALTISVNFLQVLTTQLYHHHHCQVMAIKVTTKSTDDENVAISTGTSPSTSASCSTDASSSTNTSLGTNASPSTDNLPSTDTSPNTNASPDTNTSPNIDASLNTDASSNANTAYSTNASFSTDTSSSSTNTLLSTNAVNEVPTNGQTGRRILLNGCLREMLLFVLLRRLTAKNILSLADDKSKVFTTLLQPHFFFFYFDFFF